MAATSAVLVAQRTGDELLAAKQQRLHGGPRVSLCACEVKVLVHGVFGMIDACARLNDGVACVAWLMHAIGLEHAYVHEWFGEMLCFLS